MKGIVNIAVAGCSLFLLCQCATQDDLRKLNYQVRAVNQKVEEVKTSTVERLQKRQASSVNKLDQVAEDVVRLKSRLDEQAHLQTQFQEQNNQALATLQTAMEERLAATETKLAENEARITQLQQQIEQLSAGLDAMQQARVREAERRAREAARKAELARQRTVMAATSGSSFVHVVPRKKKIRVSRARVQDAAPAAVATATKPATVQETKSTSKKVVAAAQPTVAAPAASTGSGPFARAMTEFKNRNYKKAYQDFEQVLASNPKGAKAAEVLFYMGESLYNQGEYDLAILDYQKVISNHAKDPHTPAALLKQGMSFEKLTDNETAKIIYKKLINEYSGTPEAAQAKKRLANL